MKKRTLPVILLGFALIIWCRQTCLPVVAQESYDSFSSNSLNQSQPSVYPSTPLGDVFNRSTQTQPLLTSEQLAQQIDAFTKSLPNDPKALASILDGLLRKRLNNWHCPEVNELQLWLGFTSVTIHRFAKVIYPKSYTGTPEAKCYEAWANAYRIVVQLFPHNGMEEEEPGASKRKAEATKAVELAEQTCHLNRSNELPPPAPPRSSSDHPPPLAPQRPKPALPIKPPETRQLHKLDVRVSGAVSTQFINKVSLATDSIPLQLQDLLWRKRIKLHIISRISDFNPELASEQARRHPLGETYGHLFGYTYPRTSDFVIAEKADAIKPSRKSPTLWEATAERENTNPAFDLRHEFGHSLDKALNNFSNTQDFRAMYTHDASKVPAFERKLLDYYLTPQPSGDTTYARQETFAELFAAKYGGGSSAGKIDAELQKYFKDVSNLIDKEIELLINQ